MTEQELQDTDHYARRGADDDMPLLGYEDAKKAIEELSKPDEISLGTPQPEQKEQHENPS